MKRNQTKITILLTLIVLLAGCSGGTNPHDMSVEEHKRAARELRDLEACQDGLAFSEDAPGVGSSCLWGLSGSYHAHAQEHLDAAQKLEKSEDPEACLGQAKEYMETCPLAAHAVAKVTPRPDGVEVVYFKANAKALESHIRCHTAHSKMLHEHHEDAEHCPLIGDVNVKVSDSERGAVVVFTSTDPAEQERLRGLYVPNAKTSQ